MSDYDMVDEGVHERICERYEAEIARLRAILEEFADAEHHQPPVPLWISMKARKTLADE